MTTPGHERWHPDPEFYYRPGGGPLLDMGPYYLTALVHLLRTGVRVVGSASRPASHRTIAGGPRAGTRFPVEVDTHVTGVLEHASGCADHDRDVLRRLGRPARPGSRSTGPPGRSSVPDPNRFEGEVEVSTALDREWRTLPAGGGLRRCRARRAAWPTWPWRLESGRPHRAAPDLALHVLDVMESLLQAARDGAAVAVGTTCVVPDAVDGLVDLRR